VRLEAKAVPTLESINLIGRLAMEVNPGFVPGQQGVEG
jgi:hypothetical protein